MSKFNWAHRPQDLQQHPNRRDTRYSCVGIKNKTPQTAPNQTRPAGERAKRRTASEKEDATPPHVMPGPLSRLQPPPTVGEFGV